MSKHRITIPRLYSRRFTTLEVEYAPSERYVCVEWKNFRNSITIRIEDRLQI